MMTDGCVTIAIGLALNQGLSVGGVNYTPHVAEWSQAYCHSFKPARVATVVIYSQIPPPSVSPLTHHRV